MLFFGNAARKRNDEASMTKIDASVFIITLNEERHIGRALKSVADFADIVVVDSGSIDKTLAIARQFTKRVVHHDFENYAAQKNYALSLCKKPYALVLDADEQATPALLEELRAALEMPDFAGLIIPRFDTILGKRQHRWAHTQKQIRFVAKDAARYAPKLVHESLVVDGPVRQTKNGINHYGDATIALRRAKIDKYSRLRAQEKFAAGKNPTVLKLVLVGPLIFVKTYFFRRYFLNGYGGLILSILNGRYAFLKERRLFDLWAKEKAK